MKKTTLTTDTSRDGTEFVDWEVRTRTAVRPVESTDSLPLRDTGGEGQSPQTWKVQRFRYAEFLGLRSPSTVESYILRNSSSGLTLTQPSLRLKVQPK